MICARSAVIVSADDMVDFEINNSKFIVTVRWSKGTDINSGCGQLAVLES